MDENQLIRFDIASIVTDEFAIPESGHSRSDEGEMKVNFSFNSLAEEKLIIIQVKCLFYHDDKLIIVVAVSFGYRVHPEDWGLLYNAVTNKVKLPLATALQMASMSIGAVRGILHAKTAHLAMGSIIVPSVNLKDMMREDIVIDSLPSGA